MKNKSWSEIEKEYRLTKKKRSYKNCKNKRLIESSLRRKLIKQATPNCLLIKEQLKEIYNNCPLGYDIHHTIPLTEEGTKCGLHVPWNLEILSKKEHSLKHKIDRKRNKQFN